MFTMNTRKKIIKTVYKDENDSDAESGAGDFSDSGSEAQISEHSTSAEEDLEDVSDASPGKEFNKKQNRKSSNARKPVKKKFAKEFLSKIKKQSPGSDNEQDESLPHFSVKDLTDADKLLPSFLNLSESDSSDDEASIPTRTKASIIPINSGQNLDADSENESQEKSDWTHHIQDNSEEIARKTFLELEKQKLRIEETKESLLKYSSKNDVEVSDVKDLLALGEEKAEQSCIPQTRKKNKNVKDDSESDMEDLEEVKEAKAIPQKGLQILVGIPDLVSRKTKKLDIEMMMKRKMNRVKKEHQVFMHKVHVLCWLGHGNYVSRVLNDQDILAAALSLVPSKECYPGERVDMKYVEQITTWFKDKLTLKQDKNEDKYRPKAPPLKEILLSQSKSRVCSTKKYIVFIFISMLRALGLQCRVMFNFVTLPLKPPASELCSLSIKPKEEPTNEKEIKDGTTRKKPVKRSISTSKCNKKIPQIDGNYDSSDSSESDIMQVDGNNDAVGKTKTVRTRRSKKDETNENDDVSPPKRARKSPSPRPVKAQAKVSKNVLVNDHDDVSPPKRARKSPTRKPVKAEAKVSKGDSEEGMNRISPQKRKRATDKTGTTLSQDNKSSSIGESNVPETSSRSRITSDKSKEVSPRKTRNAYKTNTASKNTETNLQNSSKYKQDSEAKSAKKDVPQILVTEENGPSTSKYFSTDKLPKKLSLNRTRSKTSAVDSKTDNIKAIKIPEQVTKTKARTKSAPGNVETSKYFDDTLNSSKSNIKQKRITKKPKAEDLVEDRKRVSHRDLAKSKTNPKNDVTGDLVEIVKARIKNAKEESKKGIVKGKIKAESDEDSDFIPEEVTKSTKSDSDDDFKPTKLSPKPRASTSRKIDRRVLSSDDDTAKNKIDVWCEVFVEELEQWIAVDVIRGKVHCSNEIYSRASHPVCYVVGWDNNNYLKDLTRRYVPHWNTVTRKQRAEASWWDTAVRPWRAPSTARDREEDEQLNRMQLEAPLPKSIAEYKNHPLYALKRHLLKFEALYPPDAQTLGFVRNEPVYARECVHVCRSRDTWLKEAKVVRMGEKPYKVVKARPKWDRLSNKLITDKPLEVFGPWQVQEYEPPVAEGGLVPRNAYGNVELFKPCMLPKGTVHIQLPGLNKVARKLNIDCAPAMTGFDFNGGWSHPVYDGFVVCEEFGEIITEAWHEDQVEQERKEIEKLETRVYGNWRRLIKGLFIRERLKAKYGFDNPTTSQDTKASKGPRLVVKKRN